MSHIWPFYQLIPTVAIVVANDDRRRSFTQVSKAHIDFEYISVYNTFIFWHEPKIKRSTEKFQKELPQPFDFMVMQDVKDAPARELGAVRMPRI